MAQGVKKPYAHTQSGRKQWTVVLIDLIKTYGFVWIFVFSYVKEKKRKEKKIYFAIIHFEVTNP